MEKENEISEGNYDFGARIYDSRIARWLSLDPLMSKYPNQSAYAGFNNNPIYFKDPDGKDGIASIKGEGTKKDPLIVTITANYYYKEANEAQKSAMSSVQSDLAVSKSVEKDGKYYKVVINVSFIQSVDPVESAKKDVGLNGGNYGNAFFITESGPGSLEDGSANNNTIKVFENSVSNISNQFSDENKAQSYKAVFRNVLMEEVLHNLGGLHQDGGGVPPQTLYSIGSGSITTKESPATVNNYSKDNAAAILNRIDKPLGTDAKSNPVDKKGRAQNPPLRDDAGTVGQTKTDEK